MIICSVAFVAVLSPRRLLLAAGLSLAVLIPATSLSAPAAYAAQAYCSPTGDYCTSAKKVNGVRLLRLGTFSFRGGVTFCVEPPRGSTKCVATRLRASRGLYEASIRWSGVFPDRGSGVYQVRVYAVGRTKIGPTLSFRR